MPTRGRFVWTDEDDEDGEYGKWVVYSLKEALAEERKVRPPRSEFWPNWHDGVPTKFIKILFAPEFDLGTVRHRPRDVWRQLELSWSKAVPLPQLAKNNKVLPGSRFKYEWSGVYRVFSPTASIHRCCGEDRTGTLYIGQAGSGRQRWSILRSRLLQIVNGRHHAISMRADTIAKKYPWGSLALQWAYTKEIFDYRGRPISEARLAESFLLYSYRELFGELPPLNEKI